MKQELKSRTIKFHLVIGTINMIIGTAYANIEMLRNSLPPDVFGWAAFSLVMLQMFGGIAYRLITTKAITDL